MDGFQFYDILLFALIAVFIILRLRAVLGRRTGQERQRPADLFARNRERPKDPPGKVIHLPDRGRPDQPDETVGAPEAEAPPEQPEPPEDPVQDGLSRIKAADPAFDRSGFLDGARMAFEMVVEGFAKSDTPVLRSLLGDDAYDEFSAAIRARLAAKHTQETTIITLQKAEIIEASLTGSQARVTVQFLSQQINVTRDESGETIEGDPTAIVSLTDIWTFGRNTSSIDPNWALVETRAPH